MAAWSGLALMGGFSVIAGLVLLALLFTADSVVSAGINAPPSSVAPDQSIAQAVVQYPPPPRGFEPLSASEAELANYGIPPRPDPRSAPVAFRHWKKMVRVPRSTNANLQETRIYNEPIRQATRAGRLRNGSVSLTSLNWSGYAVAAASGTFTLNNSFVISEWVAPVAQQALGVCDGSWDYSSQWTGFDGLSSGDVLQAGTEADAYCSGPNQARFHSAWIEWYPYPAVRVSVPIVRRGDLMAVEVWYTATPPFGHAYLANLTVGQAAAYAFNPPPGISFQGDSAEWIVERPSIGNNLANLANYVADQFNAANAYNTVSYFLPGASPTNTTTYAITMACPPWTPGSACSSATVISTPFLYGPWTLWFYDSGPAL